MLVALALVACDAGGSDTGADVHGWVDAACEYGEIPVYPGSSAWVVEVPEGEPRAIQAWFANGDADWIEGEVNRWNTGGYAWLVDPGFDTTKCIAYVWE